MARCRWWTGLAGLTVIVWGWAGMETRAQETAFAQAIEVAKRSTVGIVEEAGQEGARATRGQLSVRASGFHIRDGYIVTARHAVEREERGVPAIPQAITLMTQELDELPASLVGVNGFLDVAVYRIRPDLVPGSLAAATFASADVRMGDTVFTVGYPLGWGPALAYGRMGNPNTFIPTAESRLMQVDLAACSGNSGGGLFNERGEVVGVMHAIIQTDGSQTERRCSRFGFGVPGALVQRIVAAMIQGTDPGFARLGVQLTVVKMGTKWRVAVSDASGPALAGGVKKGDILLAIDEQPITSGAQLKNYLIERTAPGRKVTLRVLRGEMEQVLTVTLGRA